MKKRRNDVILILCILAAAALLWCAFALFSGDGAYVQVTVNGEEYGQYSLYEDRTVQIAAGTGENTLRIEDGRAYRESIVCLPHRVVVTVYGGEESSGDAVSR